MTPRILAAAIAAAACGPAPAQISGERLVAPAQPDFAPEIIQQRGVIFMSESVPKGETLDMWNRMVTVQRFPWRPGLLAEAMADSLAGGFREACPGATVTAPQTRDLGTRHATDLRADCPLNPATGKPETMFARIMLGDEMVHLVQIAFRHVPTPAETEWAGHVIADTALCTRSSSDARCK